MNIDIVTDGIRKLTDKFQRYPDAYRAAESDLNEALAGRMTQWAQRLASGDGGPQVITGAYMNGFHGASVPWGDGKTLVGIWNDQPQALRLEYGFYGSDSLGRTYHQGGFYVMNRAVMAAADEHKKELRRLPLTVWRSL